MRDDEIAASSICKTRRWAFGHLRALVAVVSIDIISRRWMTSFTSMQFNSGISSFLCLVVSRQACSASIYSSANIES